MTVARPVLVSACLLGRRCRYDGRDAEDPVLLSQMKDTTLIPVCPEELGGLGTPRPRAHFVSGDGYDVLDGTGAIHCVSNRRDVTEAFVTGASAVTRIAREHGATRAILKEGSPSCGTHRISLLGRKVAGRGVTAAALDRLGIDVEAR